MYFQEDHDIKANYYKVREGTALHEAVTSYHEMCKDFVQRAESLVAKYEADSACTLRDTFDMYVDALNFGDKNAPLCWHMDRFGRFFPKRKSKEANDFQDLTLPQFEFYYPEAPTDIRFGVLGDAIVISIQPKRNDTIRQVNDADVLTEEEFESLKARGSDEERKYIKKLGRYHWSPAPLLKTKAFMPSKEVMRLNQERLNFQQDWKMAVKHSTTGRVVRRLLQHMDL